LLRDAVDYVINFQSMECCDSLGIRRHCHGFLHVVATFLLSFLAGYADVITYSRYGSFAASMTGNTIFAGRVLAQGLWHDVFFYICIMLCWTGGSCMYHEVEKLCPRRGGTWAALVVALISTVIDVGYNLSAHKHRWWILGLVPIFGVAEAFAIGHLHVATTGVAKQLFGLSRFRDVLVQGNTAGRREFFFSLVMIVGMMTGAVVGERLVVIFGLEVPWCFMPVAPVVAAAVYVHERLHWREYQPGNECVDVSEDSEES